MRHQRRVAREGSAVSGRRVSVRDAAAIPLSIVAAALLIYAFGVDATVRHVAPPPSAEALKIVARLGEVVLAPASQRVAGGPANGATPERSPVDAQPLGGRVATDATAPTSLAAARMRRAAKGATARGSQRVPRERARASEDRARPRANGHGGMRRSSNRERGRPAAHGSSRAAVPDGSLSGGRHTSNRERGRPAAHGSSGPAVPRTGSPTRGRHTSHPAPRAHTPKKKDRRPHAGGDPRGKHPRKQRP
jgi:hypothetical protein